MVIRRTYIIETKSKVILYYKLYHTVKCQHPFRHCLLATIGCKYLHWRVFRKRSMTMSQLKCRNPKRPNISPIKH